jgi:hypothetical protein
MKKLIVLFYVLITCNAVCAQSCLPEGIIFTTQSQIDSFQIKYPGCTKIEGDVIIQGDITNLYSLAKIIYVGGNLEINLSDSLTNLNGLGNLSFIGGNLTIRGSTTWQGVCIYPALTGLAGLEKLATIGGSFVLSCLNPTCSLFKKMKKKTA